MTGTIELSDQDIQDLVNAINGNIKWLKGWRGLSDEQKAHFDQQKGRLEVLKERLLKVKVNES